MSRLCRPFRAGLRATPQPRADALGYDLDAASRLGNSPASPGFDNSQRTAPKGRQSTFCAKPSSRNREQREDIMEDIFATVVRLLRPGGMRSVLAGCILVKH